MHTGSLTKTKWIIDTIHSNISFTVKHLMITNVRGGFKIFDASIYTTDKDFTTAQVDVWIDAASIDTGDEKRDEHLRSADFFDVKNFKQIGFTTSSVEKPDKHGNHEMWGELTMKGVTKAIKLNVRFGGIVQDPWGKERAGFTITAIISRSDWGLVWNKTIEAGGLMVSDEVHIVCEAELFNANAADSILELDAMKESKTAF
jgi:polyisoprenoid-binding protein YceI